MELAQNRQCTNMLLLLKATLKEGIFIENFLKVSEMTTTFLKQRMYAILRKRDKFDRALKVFHVEMKIAKSRGPIQGNLRSEANFTW